MSTESELAEWQSHLAEAEREAEAANGEGDSHDPGSKDKLFNPFA